MQDQTKSKIFYYDDGKKRFNWRDIAAILPIIAFLVLGIGWIKDRGAEQERAKQHEKSMIEMKEKMKEMEKWQREWPSTGKLALDGVQNTRLDEHERRIGVLEK